MKKQKRTGNLLCAILAVFLMFALLSCFSGCDKKEDDNTEDEKNTESEAPVTDPIPVVLNLIVGGKSDYKIIVPEDLDQTILTATTNLISAIRDYTGAKLAYDRDFLPYGTEPDREAHEILIGATNRPESAEAAQGLGYGEYTISVVGHKLVICGSSVSATVAAVEYFSMNMFKMNAQLSFGMTDGNFSFAETDNYYHSSTYYIKKATVDGIPLSDMKIVYPAGGAVEYALALQFRRHIGLYHGAMLEIQDDIKTAVGKEILIGKTNRTTVIPDIGTYRIAITDRGLEVVSDSIFGYQDAVYQLRYKIFSQGTPEVMLTRENSWTAPDASPANLKCDSDLRIMYHNVWGYLNADQTANPNPVANRSDIATQFYEVYEPDVLCFEEAGGTFRASSKKLFGWLEENGYTEICYSNAGGIGNPIYYRSDRFECLEKGYEVSRPGDKGSTWCVLREKISGYIFAVTNSHFAANTNAGDDPTLGNQYRVQDAECLVRAVNSIREKNPEIPIITGGDYNSAKGSDPIRTLTEGGLKSMRDVAAVASRESAYIGAVTYNAELGIYDFPAVVPAGGDYAIDHIMLAGNSEALTVDEYAVVTDRTAAASSDHLMHFVDITFR